MKIVIFGAGGQLASELERVLDDGVVCPIAHAELDIRQVDELRSRLSELSPHLVINAAGYVRVDDAEGEAEIAFGVNAFAVRHLALTCRDLNIRLVHISTDYVFDGRKNRPYAEDDCPNPLNVYGASKLTGEHFVRSLCPDHLIIRTSGLFGLPRAPRRAENIVERLIALADQDRQVKVVEDQIVSPTSALQLARQMKMVIASGATGVLHLASSDHCSWFEFARAIFELQGRQVEVHAVGSKEFGSRAIRPAYSALTSRRLEELGLAPMPGWRAGLQEYLARRGRLSQDAGQA
jgi:dTDP-4-dehydrorhamnose reductase